MTKFDLLGHARGLMIATAVLTAWGCGATNGDDGAVGEVPADDYVALDEGEQCGTIVGGHCIKEALQDECGLNTGFDGDIMCLKPPAADEGFQMHIGPSDYTEEGIADFLLPPGEEGTRCVWFVTPNEGVRTYYDRIVHMRPVSHHMITLMMKDNALPASYVENDTGWLPCRGGGGGDDSRVGSFGGSETVRNAYPANGIYPPEFAGVGKAIGSHTVVRLEMHFINTTDTDLLREMWMNVYYKPAQDVTDWVNDIQIFGGLSSATQPGAHVVMVNEITLEGDLRVMNMYGHYHAHTTRFSIWREQDGQRELKYEDFDWFDPATFNYDSITDNPLSDRTLLKPGADSGILDYNAGDKFYWECEVVNDGDVVLEWTNEALTGEMCNIFGEALGNDPISTGGTWTDGTEIPIDEFDRL